MDIPSGSLLFGLVDMDQLARDAVLGKQNAALFKQLADRGSSVVGSIFMSLGVAGRQTLAILDCRYVASGEYMCRCK